MKISLSPDIERLIAAKFSSGRYHSADEVVREGLELLQGRENGARRNSSGIDADFGVIFEGIAKMYPGSDWESVPSDLSKNLDDYLRGS